MRLTIQVVAFWTSLTGLLSVAACTPEAKNNAPTPGEVLWHVNLPDHIPAMPVPPENPGTEVGVALGKALFFDPSLSINGRVSCGTCHKQELVFADGMALSNLGVTGNTLPRHTPVMQNLAWDVNGLFWDGGITNLERLSLAPIQEADEMGHNITAVVAMLNRNPDYKPRFREAFRSRFQSDTITSVQVLAALGQFMRTMVSVNSRYDLWRQGKAPMTSLELDGLQLVQSNCTPCHAEPMFTDHSFHNTGLQAEYNDPFHEYIRTGRYRITGREEDRGKFKTPSLRNIMHSAPYMHDGRIATINQVLEHYNNGVVPSPQLDTALARPGQPLGRPLTQQQKVAIKAFLHTLTDSTFIGLKR